MTVYNSTDIPSDLKEQAEIVGKDDGRLIGYRPIRSEAPDETGLYPVIRWQIICETGLFEIEADSRLVVRATMIHPFE